MHQTIKTIFRFCFALVIFMVTLSLCITCVSKIQEIMHADQAYQQAKSFRLVSTPEQQYVLVSDNQKPNNAVFVLIAGNGYISKTSCEHYAKLCSDEINQSHTRQIENIHLFRVAHHTYIEQVQWRDSRTGQVTQLEYSKNEIQQFYQNDISNLKYTVFGIALFTLAALYVSVKLLRNFRRFLTK